MLESATAAGNGLEEHHGGRLGERLAGSVQFLHHVLVLKPID